MKAIILYSKPSVEQSNMVPRGYQCVSVGSKDRRYLPVRAVVVQGDVENALTNSKPRKGEDVLNAIPFVSE